mmetsp:Transcript_82742/g.208239  ORF Transcript_82742/g.208239 Transcript_82742/m.208239 type:complete len:204 (-) Transcript_82742:1969-2580(-)
MDIELALSGGGLLSGSCNSTWDCITVSASSLLNCDAMLGAADSRASVPPLVSDANPACWLCASASGGSSLPSIPTVAAKAAACVSPGASATMAGCAASAGALALAEPRSRGETGAVRVAEASNASVPAQSGTTLPSPATSCILPSFGFDAATPSGLCLLSLPAREAAELWLPWLPFRGALAGLPTPALPLLSGTCCWTCASSR